MIRITCQCLLLLWALLFAAACQDSGPSVPTGVFPTSPAVAPSPTAALVRPPTPPVTSAPPIPAPDSGWHELRPGLERRLIVLYDDQGQVSENLYLLRIDPAAYHFNVGYRPGRPQSLEAWQAQTGALLVVNGGYFTDDFTGTGLIIANGQVYGRSYSGFGGMLAVTAAGVELRGLEEQPYGPAESLVAGLQSFPLLLKPGGQVGFPEEDGVAARRTVIAQDRAGRLLFVLAPRGRFTLRQLSLYLAESDLDLGIALNLDGGTSTGLILAEPAEHIPAFTPLPVVIVVHERPE